MPDIWGNPLPGDLTGGGTGSIWTRDLAPTTALPAPTPASDVTPIPDITPAEQEGILRRIGSNILGGAAYVGASLGKPGRAIRGLLGGNLREALAWIPFSDLARITRPEQEVSGRSLLEKYGMLGENKPGFDLGDLAGFAVDIATDPLTYLGPGALTKAGQAARKAGTLAPTLAGRIAAKQAGLFGVGLPFAEHAVPAIATGAKAEQVAQKLGQTWKMMADSPVGLHGAALFDRAVRGATDMFGQKLARDYTKAIDVATHTRRADMYNAVIQAVESGLDTPQGSRMLNDIFDGLRTTEGLDPEFAKHLEGMITDQAQQLVDIKARGGNLGAWRSQWEEKTGMKYGARYTVGPLTAVGEESPLRDVGRALGRGHTSQLSRQEILDVPGGKNMLNDMSLDKDLVPLDPLKPGDDLARRHEVVKQKYFGFDQAKEQRFRQLEPLTTQDLDKAPLIPKPGGLPGEVVPDPQWLVNRAEGMALLAEHRQAEHLADFFGKWTPEYIKAGSPLYGSAPLYDNASRLIGGDKIKFALDQAHDTLAQNAVYDALEGYKGEQVVHKAAKEGYVKMADALAQVNITGKEGLEWQADKLRRLGLITDPDSIQHVWVPKEVVGALNRNLDAFRVPKAVGNIGKIFDWFTNLFKGLTYAPWPGSTVRDFGGGITVALNEAADKGKFLDSLKWAHAAMEKGSKSPYLAEAAGWRAVEPGLMAAGELVGKDPTAARAITMKTLQESLPGGRPLKEAFKEYIPRSKEELYKFWETKGVGDPRQYMAGVTPQKDVFAPVRGGRATKEYSDQIVRLALFHNLREAGFTAEQAANRVRAALVDYADLSKFEKDVMKRVVPFYTFTRKMLPYTAETLMTKPGGLWATLLKAEYRTQHEAGFTPEYLTQGLAIPLGESAPGTRRYLTSLGLPFEQPLELMRGGPGAVSRNLLTAMGQMNPLIKGPMEFATQKQFFSGRDLGELYGITGIPGVDQILANSPASRLLSSIRTLADPRKSILTKATNLLTGARLTDVDLEKATNAAMAQAISRELKDVPGARTTTITSIPKELRGNLDVHDMQLLALQKARMAQARERAKEAK